MNRSENVVELAKALVKFNSEVNKIAKDANNPFHKNTYATLDTIIDEVRPILSKNGLSVMQIPSGDGQNVTLKTLLLHESGEWLESDALTMKPVKNDPQAIGSCVTYARRYSLAAFLSLNTGEDDDGNHATRAEDKGKKKTDKKHNSNVPPKEQKRQAEVADGQRIKAIHAQIRELAQTYNMEFEETKATVKESLGIQTFEGITVQQASEIQKTIVSWLNDAKAKQQGAL
ncbi:ERF family protein [Bacillus albus]|uniref:ERF family protein n=2 Tax=Bacillus cereus group TaxID=86661 RepID=UPI001021CEAB|nr:ERF family protein [Bacillus albus]